MSTAFAYTTAKSPATPFMMGVTASGLSRFLSRMSCSLLTSSSSLHPATRSAAAAATSPRVESATDRVIARVGRVPGLASGVGRGVIIALPSP